MFQASVRFNLFLFWSNFLKSFYSSQTYNKKVTSSAPYCFSSPVQVHTVRGTSVLQQYVDKQQLPKEVDGDFIHCHADWLAFRLVRSSVLSVRLCKHEKASLNFSHLILHYSICVFSGSSTEWRYDEVQTSV